KDRVSSHFGFDDKQDKTAADIVKRYEVRLKAFLGSKNDEIEEYEKWLERRDKNAEDKARGVASLQKQDVRIAGETRKLYAEVIPTIDRTWKDFENDLNDLATKEQYNQHGRLAIGKPGRRFGDSETMDRVIPWFDATIGVCLILGLLTR